MMKQVKWLETLKSLLDFYTIKSVVEQAVTTSSIAG